VKTDMLISYGLNSMFDILKKSLNQNPYLVTRINHNLNYPQMWISFRDPSRDMFCGKG
jgi:hypothetical protein